jgi:hypothetical protein
MLYVKAKSSMRNRDGSTMAVNRSENSVAGQAGNSPQPPETSRNPADLPPAAQRALKEAEERRRAQGDPVPPAKEIGGRGGLDPCRYGDWEIDGRAVDF